MSKILSHNTDIKFSTSQNGSEYNFDRTNGKLFFYNGSHKMVHVDTMNGNKEYIFDENGKKLYLKDIAILKLQKDKKSIKNKQLADLNKRESEFEKWKNHWFEKFQFANKSYDIFRESKKSANTGYQNVLSKTGCSSLSDLKDYEKVNGGGYLEQALGFLNQRQEATSGIIRSESDAAFYGRMYVNESNNITELAYQKAILNSVFGG